MVVPQRKMIFSLLVGLVLLVTRASGINYAACVKSRPTCSNRSSAVGNKGWNVHLLGQRTQVVYKRLGHRILTFYLFEPTNRGIGPRPVVIYIHGGALKFGTGIISGVNTPHNRLLVRLERTLIREHIDFISVNYRLAPVHPWPIPLCDVKHAVNFVIAHARQWTIRSDDIAVMGDSAGGELATFVGLTMTNRSTHRPMVRAVVDLFGPTDRQTFAQQWLRHHGLRPNPVYGVYTPKRVERESAISHVHRGSPPFLIIQGTRDRVVPPEQSYLLQARLKAAGVPVQEILVHHAGHELISVTGPIQPTLRDLADRINQFLIRYLQT